MNRVRALICFIVPVGVFVGAMLTITGCATTQQVVVPVSTHRVEQALEEVSEFDASICAGNQARCDNSGNHCRCTRL